MPARRIYLTAQACERCRADVGVFQLVKYGLVGLFSAQSCGKKLQTQALQVGWSSESLMTGEA